MLLPDEPACIAGIHRLQGDIRPVLIECLTFRDYVGTGILSGRNIRRDICADARIVWIGSANIERTQCWSKWTECWRSGAACWAKVAIRCPSHREVYQLYLGKSSVKCRWLQVSLEIIRCRHKYYTLRNLNLAFWNKGKTSNLHIEMSSLLVQAHMLELVQCNFQAPQMSI